jgi:tetratricopeptide (TPR) repeat protein
LDRAADLDPANAFFQLQAGYAHGRVALDTGDAAALQEALDRYEMGVALEPNFCVNWGNLGVLRQAAGDEAGAVAALEEAVTRCPAEPAFRLTLGSLYESGGREEAARAAYAAALDARPFWLESAFFRATPLRVEVGAAWLDTHSPDLLLLQPDLAVGWQALAAGDPAGAETFFAPATASQSADAYRGLGLAYLAQGEWALAERALRMARFVPSPNPWESSRVGIALGQLAVARGDCAAAVVEYERALDELRRSTSFGPGGMGAADYGWYIFNRDSIRKDLLPGIEYIQFTDEDVAALEQLASCYETR